MSRNGHSLKSKRITIDLECRRLPNTHDFSLVITTKYPRRAESRVQALPVSVFFLVVPRTDIRQPKADSSLPLSQKSNRARNTYLSRFWVDCPSRTAKQRPSQALGIAAQSTRLRALRSSQNYPAPSVRPPEHRGFHDEQP